MKKIILVMLCAMLIFALPIVASAEEHPGAETPSTNVTEVEKSPTDIVVDYVKENIDKIVVIVVMTAYSIIETRLRGKTIGSIGTLNNNAITVAEKSSAAIDNALIKVEGIAEIVKGYKDEMASLLNEIRNSEEEKKALKAALDKVESYLNTAKLANIELANELAELLCLANIPNAKKDELYAKHIKSVNELAAVEGVISNDGEET